MWPFENSAAFIDVQFSLKSKAQHKLHLALNIQGERKNSTSAIQLLHDYVVYFIQLHVKVQ